MDFGRATPAGVASAEVPFEALARFSLDGLALVDEHERIAAWNDAAVSITGISSESAVGSSLDSFFSNVDLGRAPHSMRLSPFSDPLHTVDAAYIPLPRGAVVSFGPQRRFAAIEHVKNEILATVSHELKTPLATIKAFADTLLQHRNASSEAQQTYLRTILDETATLERSIDELLLAARVDAHDVPVHRTTAPLSTLLDRALTEVGSGANRALERTGDVDVFGDHDLLRHALAHLIDNAFKFSEPSSAVTVGGTSHEHETVIRIEDRGIGIAQEHLPYICERFYRVENHLTASYAGMGIGLHVADAIVRAHGGSLRIESESGVGTTAVVTLPVSA